MNQPQLNGQVEMLNQELGRYLQSSSSWEQQRRSDFFENILTHKATRGSPRPSSELLLGHGYFQGFEHLNSVQASV